MMVQINADSSFKMIDWEVNEARREVSKGGRWMKGWEVAKVLSVVERGLELSTFVGCGQSDLERGGEREIEIQDARSRRVARGGKILGL